MGDRAAKRTNKMLDKFSNMYVGKNFGYSKSYAESYERVFGAKERPAAADDSTASLDVVFGPGPLGMEITWSTPPVVTAVIDGGAAQGRGVQAPSTIVQINGTDATAPIPELELDELVRQRPLRLVLRHDVDHASSGAADATAGVDAGASAASPEPEAVVQRQGVVKVPEAMSADTCKALLAFVFEERDRCLAEVKADPSLLSDRFSEVQTPRDLRAGKDAPRTRWDMRLPLAPVVRDALAELLSRGPGSLGGGFEALAGGQGAELWELGVVVSEPGAAAQRVHFDAPERCLFTAFVALQDVTPEMGPTLFFPGTNTQVAHHRFEVNPAAFLDDTACTAALLAAGDAVLYDSRVLHCGMPNNSDKMRVLLYITFRHPEVDARRLGIDQHSIRGELAGRFRLGDFCSESGARA